MPNQPLSATGADRIGNPYGRLFHTLRNRWGGRMSRLHASRAARIALVGVVLSAARGPAQDPINPSPPASGSNATVVPASPVASSPEILRPKALSIPSTSVAGIGTNQIPVDLTQGRLPEPVPLPFGPDRQDGWAYSNKAWVAPVFFHQPTYYEDMMLENHGHERHPALQPMLSGARFYSGIFFTPYLYCLNGPFENISSAGRYRPGTMAPGLRQRAPYSPYAIGTQAVSTGSGILLLKP